MSRARVDYPAGRSVVYRAGKIYDIVTEYARPLLDRGLAEVVVDPPTGRSLQDAEEETPVATRGRSAGPGTAFRKPRQSRHRPAEFDNLQDEGSPREA